MTSCFDDLYAVDPSPAARRLLWHVLSVGSVWRDEPESHPARDKAGAFLFWVVSGTGTLKVGDDSWQLAPGQRVWMVNLGIPRAYLPERGQRLVTSGIRFSGPGLDNWREAMNGGGEFEFSQVAASSAIRKQQKRILGLVTRRSVGYEWKTHECLTRILGELLTQRHVLSSKTLTTIPAPVTRVINAVLSDPCRGWRAAELAKIAGVSYSGLRSQFREVQQESLSDFLQRTRLHEARLLLSNDSRSMKEVAAHLHFSSEFYFSQWFRRQTGYSPTKFRLSLRD